MPPEGQGHANVKAAMLTKRRLAPQTQSARMHQALLRRYPARDRQPRRTGPARDPHPSQQSGRPPLTVGSQVQGRLYGPEVRSRSQGVHSATEGDWVSVYPRAKWNDGDIIVVSCPDAIAKAGEEAEGRGLEAVDRRTPGEVASCRLRLALSLQVRMQRMLARLQQVQLIGCCLQPRSVARTIGDTMETECNNLSLLMNARDVAEALGVSERSVWRLAAIGDIPPPVRIGRSTRWRRSTIDSWLTTEERRAARRQKAEMRGDEEA